MDEAGVEPIAVIGMACRVPGAGDVAAFWRNLVGGVLSRTELGRDRLLAAGVPPEEIDDPAFVPVGYLLDDVESFDAGLFGLTAREAALVDPQHRLFLELCHAALEDAGWDPARFDGDIGVYGGRGMETYRWHHVYRNRAVAAVSDHMTVGIGNHADAFTTLVSYRLNLGGPSVGIYTACSTSLVAVHVAAEALRAGECDMALAGGVTIELPAGRGYLHHEGGAESADGYCRPFDATATGTVWGSGGGAVLLKRLSDAIADRDHVRAVVLGNAINNDGAGKVGFTAPSVDGQAAVIANALEMAGVDPRTVSYVEAHGTATALGDPIEVAALTSVFGASGAARGGDRQWCGLGSVKSNVGHLSHGAGVVSLIKTVLSLEYGLLPPSLGYTTPNPAIDFAASPFYVNATLAKWEPDGGARRAGVSSFGIGGTNVHVVLEARSWGSARVAPASSRPAHLLQVSAGSAAALDAAATRLADHLGVDGGAAAPDLADVAYTLRAGRAHHPHRTAVVAADHTGAVAALRRARRPAPVTGGAPPVVLLFTGQGSQYAGMGAQLYASEPAFAAAVDRCVDGLAPHLDGDLRGLLFPATDGRAAAEARLTQTAFAQPALFTIGYACAQLWASWGIRPAAMVGHSIGEYVAATLAGVFDLPAALRLVALRGRLMQAMPAGAMLAVSAPAERVGADLPHGLSIAAVNGPGICVVAGPTDLVDAFAADLSTRRVTARRLRTSHAFHSAMMDPILDEFAAAVAAARPAAPALPFLSNRTGAPITAAEAVDPAYWAAHLREPVRYGDCVARALADSGDRAVLLECGPGRQLANLARMQVPRGGAAPRHHAEGAPPPSRTLHTLPGPGEPDGDVATCYAAAGRLWEYGVPLAPDACGGPAHRVPLPVYPYERVRHWIDPDPVGAPADVTPAAGLGRRPLDDWFTVPGWRRLPPVLTPEPPATAVVFAADAAGTALADALRAAGTRVATVEPGDGYARPAPGRYTVRPAEPTDHAALVHDAGTPDRWVHAWSLAGEPAAGDPGRTWAAAELGLFSLFHLVQALAAAGRADGATVDVVTAGTQRVLDTDLRRPEHALVAGVTRSVPYDVPGLRLRHIDAAGADLIATADEIRADPRTAPDTVALRGGHRWAPAPEPVRLPAPGDPAAGLRPGGVYLITGGLGALGLAVAEDLARRARGRLVLVGRTLPPARVAAAVDRMTAAGGAVEAVAADVTDAEALQRVRATALARFGRLDGIVHAAGVAGGGLTELRTRADMLPVLAAKVTGTLALRRVFGDLELDFVALFSSVVGAVGGLGEVDYSAANAYLDAYAQSAHGWRAPVRSLAWAGWLGGGMLGASTVDESAAMTPAEGVAAFHRVIAAPNLGAYVLITPTRPERAPVDAPTPPTPVRAERAPDCTAAIATIWAALFGVDRIEPDADFFDLGGNSLLAVQLIAQVRKEFGVRLPMRAIFDTPTVAGMAAEVTRLRKPDES
jgi:acyl transferase domain-containing protein/acyl carrier protein